MADIEFGGDAAVANAVLVDDALRLDDLAWDDRLDDLAWTQRTADDPDRYAASDPSDFHPPGLALPTVDPDGLSVPERVDALVQLQRIASRVAALEAELMVSLMGTSPVQREVLVLDRVTDEERTLTLTDEMREELALALRRSPGQVHEEVRVARLLATALPATRAALAEGFISARHARTIATQAERLGAASDSTDAAFVDACARLEHRVVERAGELTVPQTRDLARRAVESIDRDAARRRRLAQRREVDVRTYAEDDGIAVLYARLPAVDAARVRAAIDVRARADESLDRTAGQRRATALVELVCGSGKPAHGSLGDRPAGLEVGVVVDLRTLLGLADTPASLSAGQHWPIDISAIREVLERPDVPVTLRRLVCDPATGALLDRGRRTYQVTGALRAFLVARDRTCRFPGCGRSSAVCEIDHADAWDDGGRTDIANLGSLCVRHHQLKTHGDWQITSSGADGSCSWRSPLGQVADIPPRPVLPDPVLPDPELPDPEPEPPPTIPPRTLAPGSARHWLPHRRPPG